MVQNCNTNKLINLVKKNLSSVPTGPLEIVQTKNGKTVGPANTTTLVYIPRLVRVFQAYNVGEERVFQTFENGST